MKNRKKISLEALRVKSFVTLQNGFEKQTIKGGGSDCSNGPPTSTSAGNSNYTEK